MSCARRLIAWVCQVKLSRLLARQFSCPNPAAPPFCSTALKKKEINSDSRWFLFEFCLWWPDHAGQQKRGQHWIVYRLHSQTGAEQHWMQNGGFPFFRCQNKDDKVWKVFWRLPAPWKHSVIEVFISAKFISRNCQNSNLIYSNSQRKQHTSKYSIFLGRPWRGKSLKNNSIMPKYIFRHQCPLLTKPNQKISIMRILCSVHEISRRRARQGAFHDKGKYCLKNFRCIAERHNGLAF